jgi:hypothetical protein
MRLVEIQQHYYHGSSNPLPVGTVLKPRGEQYQQDWQDTDFYWVLERYLPSDQLPHSQSVFMVADPDDVELAGGATDWMFTVKPLGPVQPHDLNWSSEISMLISNGQWP